MLQATIGFEKSLAAIKEKAPRELKIAIEQACVKGASSWVTARPLHTHPWTVLYKSQFRDAIYLRYGWEPKLLPEKCGCGAPLRSTRNQCMVGGFRGLMHNEVQYVFYNALKEAGFKDVRWEPDLQALEGETFKYKALNKTDEARSDVSVLGFYSRLRKAFFDVTAFSPFALSKKGERASRACSRCTRNESAGNTLSGFATWSMATLHHWYFQRLAEWGPTAPWLLSG